MTTLELLRVAWRFDPLAALGCAGAAFVLAAVPASRHVRRAAYVIAAASVLLVALVSPIGALADGYLFSAHMLQHLLLLLVVPPLALLAWTRPEENEPPPMAPSPAVPGAWLGGVLAMWVWHAPALCNAAAERASVHLVQEASLLLLGTWFFWPILSPRAKGRLPPLPAIVYLFTACTACTLLGIAVTFSPVEVCAAYLAPKDPMGALPLLREGWGLTPMRDQQIGGLLMWLPACLVYGAAILGILWRWYRAPETPVHAPAGLTEGREEAP